MSSRGTLLSFDLSKCFYIDTQGGTAARYHHDITHYSIGDWSKTSKQVVGCGEDHKSIGTSGHRDEERSIAR